MNDAEYRRRVMEIFYEIKAERVAKGLEPVDTGRPGCATPDMYILGLAEERLRAELAREATGHDPDPSPRKPGEPTS